MSQVGCSTFTFGKNIHRLPPKQRVLVTGGAGFIGSNLIEHLIAHNHQVTCLDNFLTGKMENLSGFIGNPNFELIEGDIRDPRDCAKACKNKQIIFHQAALGSVPRSIHDPILSAEINIMGSLHLLLAARDAGVPRYVYASSSSVYGDDPALPKVENETGRPLSPYATTKYCNELFAHNFAEHYNMTCVGLRYFNVFGPRQDPSSLYAAVIPKFTSCLLHEEAPTIFGDGSNSRDFTYIKNVIHANLLAATYAPAHQNFDVFNVACGIRVSINDLFASIRKELTRYNPRIQDISPIYTDNRAGDVPHSNASIDKGHTLMGYTPIFNFDAALKSTLEWYVDNHTTIPVQI